MDCSNSPPVVSFITTVRNGEALLPACMESVRGQQDRRWEHIIVDDGSTDDTQAVADRAAAGDQRFRIIPTDGVGRGAALNRALGEASAPIVTILDSDDLAHPRRVEAIGLLAERLHDFGVICGRSSYLYGADSGGTWEPLDVQSALQVRDVTAATRYGNPIAHNGSFMRRDLVLGLGGYDESRERQFDYDLWVRMVEAGFRLGRTPVQLHRHRIHERQSFERAARFSYLRSSASVQLRAIRLFPRRRLLPYLSLAFRLIRSFLSRPIRNLFNVRRS